jgi:hypothetical protein
MSSAISAPTSKHLHLLFTFINCSHADLTLLSQFISISHASSNHVHQQTFISISHASSKRSSAFHMHQAITFTSKRSSASHIASNHITTPHAHQQMARSQNDALTHAHHQTTKLHYDALTFISRKAKQRHRRENFHSTHATFMAIKSHRHEPMHRRRRQTQIEAMSRITR